MEAFIVSSSSSKLNSELDSDFIEPLLEPIFLDPKLTVLFYSLTSVLIEYSDYFRFDCYPNVAPLSLLDD